MSGFTIFAQNLCATKWTNYLLDGIIILFIVGYSILCAKRGFIDCFFSFFATIIATALAIFLAKSVLSMTGGLFGLQESLENTFINKFGGSEALNVVINAENLESSLAENKIPSFIASIVVKTFGSDPLPAGTTLAMVLGTSLAKLLSLVIVAIILFIIFLIVLVIVRKSLTAIIEKISLLNAVNWVLGLVVGVAKSIFIICLILMILSIIPIAAIEEYIYQSVILKFLYEKNVISWLIGLLF